MRWSPGLRRRGPALFPRAPSRCCASLPASPMRSPASYAVALDASPLLRCAPTSDELRRPRSLPGPSARPAPMCAAQPPTATAGWAASPAGPVRGARGRTVSLGAPRPARRGCLVCRVFVSLARVPQFPADKAVFGFSRIRRDEAVASKWLVSPIRFAKTNALVSWSGSLRRAARFGCRLIEEFVEGAAEHIGAEARIQPRCVVSGQVLEVGKKRRSVHIKRVELVEEPKLRTARDKPDPDCHACPVVPAHVERESGSLLCHAAFADVWLDWHW